MKTRIPFALAIIALASGCADTRKHMGGSRENDHNVLSGGPITGVTIQDLPQAVQSALKQRVPTAEIADIEKQTQDGHVFYKISFSEPAKNPTMCLAEDGTVVEPRSKKDAAGQNNTR